MRMRLKHIAIIVLLMACGMGGSIIFLPHQAIAQKAGYMADWNSITIQGWAEDMRIRLLDRRHTVSGFITDRGAFQMYTYRMNPEFGLNLFTYRYTPQEDYLWYRSPNGIRTYAGNSNGLNLATKTEIKTDVEISEGHTVQLQLKQQADARASRVWAEPSYAFNFAGKHAIGVSHTVSNYKPDLDATFFYQYGNQQEGMFKLAYSLMDYANDWVFPNLESQVSYADTVRVYDQAPRLWNIKALSPQWGRFRFEAEVGFQRESKAEIYSPRDSLDRYQHNETNSYQTAMLEYDSEFITAGVVYQRHHSEMERDTLLNSNNHWRYNGHQTMRRLGVFLLANSQDFRWETWAWMGKYEDYRKGERYPFDGLDSLDHGERRLELRSRIMKRPQIKGLIAGFEYTMLHRIYKNDQYQDLADYYTGYYQVDPFNTLEHRGSVLLGYQFHPRASFVIGASYDLDGDFYEYPEGQRFDTAFGRLEIRW
ncbi:MAG: hypothetical protein ACQETE_10390 [Bacteroidota bacterium]